MFVRIEVLDCFIQKPSSIVTSVFFITNRPLYAQIILGESIVARRRGIGKWPTTRRPGVHHREPSKSVLQLMIALYAGLSREGPPRFNVSFFAEPLIARFH